MTLPTSISSVSESLFLEFSTTLSDDAKVILPSHGEAYDLAIQRWSLRAERKALAVVIVANAEDVSKTVIFATGNSIPFVVKSGGHSPSGHCSIHDGIVIDLCLLKKTVVNVVEQTVTVETGCLTGEVAEAVSEYGFASVIGSSPFVGVGGYMLHGGHGQLTGEYGLGVDNIVGAEVVTAKGDILWADKDTNTDLFWAIRGAANMFGIVTKFVLNIYPINHSVWSGTILYAEDKIEAVVKAVNNWYDKKDKKAYMILAIAQVPTGKTGLMVITHYYGPQEKAEEVFAELLDIEPIFIDVSEKSYLEATKPKQIKEGHSGYRCHFASANIRPNLNYEHIQSIVDTVDDMSVAAPAIASSVILITIFQPDGIQKHDVTDMAFGWRDGSIDVAIGMRWSKESDTEDALLWAEKLRAKLLECGNSSHTYSNHNDFEGPGVFRFSVNYPKLCELKKVWDPSNVFMSV
ncbi:hypothetical protein BDF14DRAFT_1821607 [Spinellus fusiger]|nr:hypothetical protein BDF14DRAFT_1821607 [Spinellus fusiger]